MSNALGNIKLLKTDMEQNGWCIEGFDFELKGQGYVVLIRLYSGVKPSQYALVELEFIRLKDNERFITYAHSNGLGAKTKEIREFFGIEYSEHLKDAMEWLNGEINKAIPVTVGLLKNEQVRSKIVESLSKSDSESVDAIYCYDVLRNGMRQGKQKHRSIFNDNKTRYLRPDLYKAFEQDDTISFCYSENPSREQLDSEIKRKFAQRQ